MIKQLRARQEYVKPSVRKRDQLKKAIYIQKLRDEEMKNE